VIFLDASVLLAAEDTDDLQHAASLALLRTGDLATIDLALYETTNVAVQRWRDHAAAQRLRQRIWSIAEFGALVRIDAQLGDDIAHLAGTTNLSGYDAAYLAGARRLGLQLVSCDVRDLVQPGHAQLPSAVSQP
jgi:predicted nucleic acid-binding protein